MSATIKHRLMFAEGTASAKFGRGDEEREQTSTLYVPSRPRFPQEAGQ